MLDKLQHEMYLNILTVPIVLFPAGDKLQHEMYLNATNLFFNVATSTDKLQHEMYLNDSGYADKLIKIMINFNMRCI